MGWSAAAVLRRSTGGNGRAVYGLGVAPGCSRGRRLSTAMMARGECPKWIVLYRGWSTVLRELVMLVEDRKTVVVGSGVESGGSCDGGHCS